MNDKSTYFNISAVLMCILLIVVSLIYVAINFSFTSQADDYMSKLEERISPLGQVYVEGDIDLDAIVTAPVVETIASTRSGEEVYQASCSVCHVAGVAGAPKYGDIAAWAPRVDLGISVLLNSVINGKGAMPAKGTCTNCSNEELEAATNYMLDAVK